MNFKHGNYETVYNIVKKILYSKGKVGNKKHGMYLHVFSKDKRKVLKMDTYNGNICFGIVSENIIKTYDKFNNRFIYGNNDFTGVRCIPKFFIGEHDRYTTEKDLEKAVNAYKFLIKNA